eukprot:3904066-Prymnesium_polylepis.2
MQEPRGVDADPTLTRAHARARRVASGDRARHAQPCGRAHVGGHGAARQRATAAGPRQPRVHARSKRRGTVVDRLCACCEGGQRLTAGLWRAVAGRSGGARHAECVRSLRASTAAGSVAAAAAALLSQGPPAVCRELARRAHGRRRTRRGRSVRARGCSSASSR